MPYCTYPHQNSIAGIAGSLHAIEMSNALGSEAVQKLGTFEALKCAGYT